MSAPLHDADDYGPDGLFRDGPQRTRPRFVPWMVSPPAKGPTAPPPNVAREQAAGKRRHARALLERQRRFLAAIGRAG